MDIHPIQESSRRWMTALILAVVAAGIQTTLLWGYAGADTLPAAIDGILSVGLLCLLAYLAWYVIGLVSILQTDLLIAALALLFWLAGGFAVQYVLEQNMGQVYAPFGETLPFRILFGALAWGVMMLWYRLQSLNTVQEEILEEAVSKEEALREELRQIECREDKALPEEAECIDRITVKDGTHIHLIRTDELLYIQACGDYVTLVTPSGQYVKEQTMKYFDAHLPSAGFVRVHRSTIVNVTQISQVELFGKENYQLSLKNGVRLKVSNSGYKLLKERLEL